ncbi:glycosyl transferase [Desulfosarcina alkanivorans]|uniref:Glycosyl transferase n=1 Tax=Desulfosarcina alkanivorans TaxID=571177 RepID=A0A5K7YCS5_9BACT|nr:glycosyltransferase family 2 protein [Desulfosarcina alkanivorans]BBO67252.1 glycosyl transferase [Desulfosarcina alkanivorans]
MQVLFILCVFMCVYSYAIYPPMLWCLALFFKKSWQRGNDFPRVSIVISAFNEAAVIQKKIRNALALEYPSEMLEIIVSSDGSTDDTNTIVQAFDDPRVKLMAFERIGKTACLNKVIPQVSGEIVVFTDANSMFPAGSLKRMVRHFKDQSIGLVTGGTLYIDSEGNLEPTGIYSKLEKWTKVYESAVASCVGADGAIFALRKELYHPLSNQDINDLVIPLQVVRGGKRVIIEPNAPCIEEASSQGKQAMRRQIRISTRTIWALYHNRDLLNIKKHGFFAYFMWSHKLLRLTMPFWFIAAFVLNMYLIRTSTIYWIPMLGFLTFLFIGIGSMLGSGDGRIPSICKLFLITGVSQFIAWMRVWSGKKDVLWTPQR